MHKVVLPIRLDPDLPRNFSICFCFDGERWRLGTLGRSLLPGGVNVNVGSYFLNVGHEPRFTSSFLRMPDNKCNMIMLEFLNLFLWVTLETGADVCGDVV